MTVETGQPAPDFSAPATGDQTLSLSDFHGKTLVLYFYPKDNTPGCTQEGQDFRDLHAEFQAAGAQILVCLARASGHTKTSRPSSSFRLNCFPIPTKPCARLTT